MKLETIGHKEATFRLIFWFAEMIKLIVVTLSIGRTFPAKQHRAKNKQTAHCLVSACLGDLFELNIKKTH